MAAQIKALALKLLAGREHSRLELSRKLRLRGYSTADIEPVLAQLVQAGQLDDQRFAAAFIRSRISKGQGPLKIQHALQARGINQASAMLAINWEAFASQVRAKKFGAALPDDLPAQARQAQFLKQRGFLPTQIRYALKHPAADQAGVVDFIDFDESSQSNHDHE